MSIVISTLGSASIASQMRFTESIVCATGTSPFLVQLLRKMSLKLGAMTASNPYCWIAHTACSRDEPTPKLGPATRTDAVAYFSSLSTKLRSSRHVANRPFSKPVRSTRLSHSAGMIWSVSTSDRLSGSPVPEMTFTAFIACSSQVLRGREVAGHRGGGGDGGGDEVSTPTAALATLEV